VNWKHEWKPFTAIAAVFVTLYWLPVGNARFDNAVMESLLLARWYAREHVLLCLVPAFFIAGAIAVFVSRESVMKYLGPGSNKIVAYGVASVSGSVLAVCSCTVLPLFAGIYRMGAGLGPAVAFLYAGPAVNVLAIILTARILGPGLGLARAVGAVAFSIVIGFLMHLLYLREEKDKTAAQMAMPEPEVQRSLGQNAVYLVSMVGILVWANWGAPQSDTGLWYTLYSMKWLVTAGFAGLFALVLVMWFGITLWKMLVAAAATGVSALLFPHEPVIPFTIGVAALSVITATGTDEMREWTSSTWDFAKQIVPLLLIGVVIAGLLLGRPGHEGVIPASWIGSAVGGNSIRANFFASFAGAFMYFATLTEVPILQGLIGSGMGKGPALALLLAGPALSLPNMLVIRSVMGTKKTIVFVALVIIMATVSGVVYGALAS